MFLYLNVVILVYLFISYSSKSLLYSEFILTQAEGYANHLETRNKLMEPLMHIPIGKLNVVVDEVSVDKRLLQQEQKEVELELVEGGGVLKGNVWRESESGVDTDGLTMESNEIGIEIGTVMRE